MARMLADGRTKLSILTEKPENVDAPTVSELEAGNDASCNIFYSDFNFGAQPSTTADVKVLCQTGNAQTPTMTNHQAEFTVYRGFGLDSAEGDDSTALILLDGHTTVWAYARKTEKRATAAWEEGDEIYMGGEFITDVPQQGDNQDYIKIRTMLHPQQVHDYIEVAAASAG